MTNQSTKSDENNRETILIIGGSSGIGLATAQLGSEKGYKIIIASRSQEKLDHAKQQINSKRLSTFQVDILDDTSIRTLFNTVGNIDHLVITGSEVHFGHIGNSSIKDAKESFDSKFFGPFRVIKEALNGRAPKGSITLFSGTAGAKPEKGTEILSAINSAIEGFARALAISLAPIRVNCVSPGIIDTPVYLGLGDDAKKLFQQFTDKLVIKRMGEAKEVADAVLYLINNNYVTGTTLYVDGGHIIS